MREEPRRAVHPDIDRWAADSGGGGLDHLDYAAQRLELPDWLAVARCLRPTFVEVLDCVIWDRAYEPENFQSWYTHLHGDATSVEAVLNQFRLWHVVDSGSTPEAEKPEMETYLQRLAEDIAFCWRSTLESDFPRRSFEVRVLDTEDGPVVQALGQR
ncbi:hypothetical protein ACFW4X_08340 [Streptomyces smyrnaeus]|uniref:hypothetical protein n=1 Tax=Streptomyces smyrnaeus TaxID=1387713 RepID=UPI0036BF32D0